MRSARSNTVTWWPARFSWSAAARPAGPEPTTATRLPVRDGRRPRLNPALLERALDDRQLDRLDRHRIVVDAEHARALARRRAQPSGPLGKVVGRVQPVARRLPALAVDEIVPVGDQVAERTALMAERNAAVHAARALVAHLALRARADRPRCQSRTRSWIGRACGLARLISMKPVTLPIGTAPTSSSNAGSRDSARACASAMQHALVVARHDLDETCARATSQSASSDSRHACCRCSARGSQQHVATTSDRVVASSRPSSSTISRLQRLPEVAARVEHVGDAAAHAGGEVAAGPAEHDARARRSCTRSRDRRRPRRRRRAPLLRTAKRSPAMPRT